HRLGPLPGAGPPPSIGPPVGEHGNEIPVRSLDEGGGPRAVDVPDENVHCRRASHFTATLPAIQWYEATGGMTRLVASIVATSRRVLGPPAMRAQASSHVPASQAPNATATSQRRRTASP